MIDKNGVEIKAGDLVKKTGFVVYAHGPREKVSKKTWVATEKDGVLGLFLNDWEPFDSKEGVEYIIVGSVNKGMEKKYTPLSEVAVSAVFEKFKLLKDVPSKGWKKGDVVQTNGKVAKDDTTFEWVADNVQHQHVLVVVDPIKVGLVAKFANK